jgi:hypothetical protein
MLDDYLKKLENMITPQTYSKQNYKSKFNMGNINTNDQMTNEVNHKLLEDYINKMGVRANDNPLAESRIRVYNKILDSDDKFQIPPDDICNENKMINKTQSMSPSQNNEKERIHHLNLKNMNYRHEIETLKNRLNSAVNELDEYKMLVNKLERQKDSDNKYLLKLESMLENNKGNNGLGFRNYTNSSMADISKISRKTFMSNDYYTIYYKTNTIIIEDKYSDNIIAIADKDDLKQYILNILTENRRLKDFQKEVYEISKNYDDINSTMLESIKILQNTLTNDQRLKIEEDGKLDLISNL